MDRGSVSLPEIELDDANTTANLHCGKCDRTEGQGDGRTLDSQLPAIGGGLQKKNFANFWRRSSTEGGGGQKEADKEGGEGNITGELGNRNRCHRHARREGRGGKGRFVEMEKHSFSQKEGGKRLLTTARTRVQQIFLTGRHF